ncbi:hypothetical protein ACJDU8_17585 [Clostridium sp. WILCCON 0269]|uniref:BC1881 family protein n=1 Tax=Candidatus Clostridium eludens TaxID=3381663 RepID=A0ABW8SNZ3_9CLOT
MIKNVAENLTLDECISFNREFGITLTVTDGKDIQVDIEPGIYVSFLGVLIVE